MMLFGWSVEIVRRWGWAKRVPSDPVYVSGVWHRGPLLVIRWV